MKRTIVITGATSGIGKETALAFAKLGDNIVVSGRREKEGLEVVNEIKSLGANAIFVKTDITQENEVKALIEQAVAHFGKIDVMVNNSGIAGRENVPLHQHSTENFRELIEVNVMGLFWGMKYAIDAMLKTGGGVVVNLASIAGLNGIEFTSQYSASKHAVVGLTKSASLDYATQGIRVNAVAPGAIKTDILQNAINAGVYPEDKIAGIHPMNKMGDTSSIANAIVFLASPDVPFMTGTILNVDGGFCAK
ncbi:MULTISPECIES: SDR family NAD(P)-dependent oxidoreductase [Pseudomonadota]|uniref:3-oxoacyl-[acyl-carrier-protein] reductase FabG n=1 Tax=Alysiella crassa TaxID=153491 RepID=A0A376BN05_9NEIS|nr:MULTISPECIES: glucose 1-dehydrogenase [Pseudomonadota]AGH37371.1 3-oxoacyl-(Acyl-carrier-protein) reductase [Bibersteinia trehalosi USDA-ARS-USMARC-192]UOP06851.1 glucose 1-dehydrogenase [Alysiella crassa]WGE78741.1 glucose 1-dehydrogenase [Actinobacillus equuli subsp. equuli]WGE89592.1 glucose 1-dehydrogenase [Actinobacillus arthritidis]SSY71023.1 3-oxoacyl-[acyl-carrier-protein] reductase FabG [Alysiella crassa]